MIQPFRVSQLTPRPPPKKKTMQSTFEGYLRCQRSSQILVDFVEGRTNHTGINICQKTPGNRGALDPDTYCRSTILWRCGGGVEFL